MANKFRGLRAIPLGIIAACVAWAAQPYSRDEGDSWIAGNDGMEIAVSKRSGSIQKVLDRVSGEDYCNQTVPSAGPLRNVVIGPRIAGITLFDELRNKEYSDLNQDATVTGVRAASSAGATILTLNKTFPGADFSVTEIFTVSSDHLRWDVKLKKTAGADRTVRVIQFAPLPLGTYRGWAPISDGIPMKPYTPFTIEYGQSVYGSVGESRWRTNIPMMVFYSTGKNRALSLTAAFEVPSVRIRFMNNTGATVDFHWNSRHYPLRERPYVQIVNEYLGLRDRKDVETSLLISTHPADWRPALGWVYEKYRKYFDPDPNFEKWDGAYALQADLLKDTQTDDNRCNILTGRRDRGVRWEEQHGHFPWYGLMIPKEDVRTWVCESHLPREQTTLSRDKIRRHHRMNREHGIGTFIYYNTTEAEYWYAQDQFTDSIAKDEDGKPSGAYRVEEFPGKRACWLMNSDPKTPFGRHMHQQARDLIAAYPDLAGFFWDVYGRSYVFDFAHDDGITMVNNRPAYYPGFMFERMMREIRPLLAGKGLCVTANKPTTITSCEGIDGIMVSEDTPEEETPTWIAAQSFLGLNRHVMILDNGSGSHPELFFQTCLRYGLLYSDLSRTDRQRSQLPTEKIARNAEIEKAYAPFVLRFPGKKWIFHPRALELPAGTDGNIFRLKDGSVMIAMVSTWRTLRNYEGFDRDVRVTCRLPDADRLTNVYVSSPDLGGTVKVSPERNGDAMTITVPRHGRSTVILLSATPDRSLE